MRQDLVEARAGEEAAQLRRPEAPQLSRPPFGDRSKAENQRIQLVQGASLVLPVDLTRLGTRVVHGVDRRV